MAEPQAPDPLLQSLLGVVRTLAALGAGSAYDRGLIAHDDVSQVTSLLAIIGVAAWSIGEKVWSAHRHDKVTAAVATMAAEHAAWAEQQKYAAAQVPALPPAIESLQRNIANWPLRSHD